MKEEFAPYESAEQPELNAGDQIGSFTLIEFLGKGGMGHVWKANDGKSEVALKFLKPDLLNDPEEVGCGFSPNTASSVRTRLRENAWKSTWHRS